MDFGRFFLESNHMKDLANFVTPARKENLQQVVYQQLCRLILQGGIEPGQAVTVATLSEALDVSPMPVREAISRLTAAGALTTVSGRSIGVPRLSCDDFEDLRNVRIETESIALRWAIERRTEIFLETMNELYEQLVEAEKDADNLGFIDLNYQFHFAIYQQAGSPILLGVIQNLWLRISPYFHLLDAKGHLQISNKTHKALMSAIKKGDIEKAENALITDITKAYEKLVKLIAE